MSLDVSLYPPNRPETSKQKAVALLLANGFKAESDYLDCYYSDPDYIFASFESNITHNLSEMAQEAGIYFAMWRPDEVGYKTAGEIAPILEEGLALMKSDPERFRKHSAENGWGTYEQFVPWVERYLDACKQYPNHVIEVSR